MDWLLYQVATKLGITAALGDSDEARLALWQIIARTLDQGSRLSAARLARKRGQNGRFWNTETEPRSEERASCFPARKGGAPFSLLVLKTTNLFPFAVWHWFDSPVLPVE